jgi:small-conductance mechanosensitive channel
VVPVEAAQLWAMVVHWHVLHISRWQSWARTLRAWRALIRVGLGTLVVLGFIGASAAAAAATTSATPAKGSPAAGPSASKATAATAGVTPTTAATAATSAPTAAQAVSPLTAAQVIQFLDQTIDWYHGLAQEQRIATTPGDMAVVYDNRQAAVQAVRQAFDFARSQAGSVAQDSASNPGQNSALSQYQSLRQLQVRLDKQVKDTQAELDADRQKLASASAKQRQELQSQVAELQGELDLAGARRDAVASMVEFVNGGSTNGLGATGVRAQIEALARTVPGMAQAGSALSAAGAPAAAATVAPAAALASKSATPGIWELTANVFALASKGRTINSLIRQTEALADTAKQLRQPFLAQLQDLSSRGDTLGKQADTADNATLQAERAQLDELAGQFKRLSAAVIPLSKQGVVLDLYKRSLSNWKDAVRNEYRSDLSSLAVRLGFLALIILSVFAAAELWRRAVYRYVHDPRRRYQFLLMRRFVIWFVMAIIIAFAFASSLGSIGTFAGLLTAGIAVAMQGVIVSIVGYFFLIGKFGIRVGDRVQIGGVTGEVVDVGLVRFHLMELGGSGADGPTGRVVAFSNSIVFQVAAGLFKQIHGINFAWHEITLTLASQENYAAVKERLSAAVQAALADYRAEIERQNQEIARTIVSTPVANLEPKVLMRFSATGVEAVIRYPVDLKNAADIDERVWHELLQALEREPKVELAGSSPEMHLSTDIVATDTKT